MTKLISIENVEFAHCPSSASKCLQRAEKLCEELEMGNIVFFPKCPFNFSKEKIDFLLQQKQTNKRNRKNIAYKPNLQKLSNVQASHKDFGQFYEIMKEFSQSTTLFLSKLLTPYASSWKVDYASFRPFQEKGRKLRVRARNDLLHTDAFPSRPVHGQRILRFFININPNENRQWVTADHFEELMQKFGGTKELPFPKPLEYTLKANFARYCKKTANAFGLFMKQRSPYDHFMLKMHHFLKENQEFQNSCKKDYWDFPPGSCWMVFTDYLSHAALRGKYALEQTFFIPRDAQVNPEMSPLSILERKVGYQMLDPIFSQ